MGVLFAATYVFSLPLLTIFDYSFLALTFIFWATFVVLTVYDMKHTLVPYAFSFTLLGSALAVRVGEGLMLQSAFPLTDALFGALLFGGFLFALALGTRGKGMGTGDGYVGLALGAFFGVAQALEVLVLSFWVGAGVGIVLLIAKKGFKMKTEVPFVPFLFVASVVGAFTNFSALALVSTALYGI